MADFAKAVDDILRSLREYKQPLVDDEESSLSWNNICKDLLHILRKYPTGVTKSIILSELLVSSKLRPTFERSLESRSGKPRDRNGIVRNNRILEILETKQVDFNSVLECIIKESVSLPGSETLILKLADSKCLNDSDAKCIEMYLHQKIKCCGDVFKTHPLLMTGLRLHKVQNKGLHRLLPSEYVVPVLNRKADRDFIKSRFSTLEGIDQEDQTPHYTRNVLLTIKTISPVETIHLPYGDSVHRSIVNLVDADGSGIDLHLWDEKTVFINLFNPDDTLAIEEPFLVNEDGDVHLEYGPATIFYIIPGIESTETVPSQVETATVSHVKKTSDGRLDFNSYKVRFTSKDMQRNSVNVCYLCLVVSVSPKAIFKTDGNFGHLFTITVKDEFGKLSIDVFDESFTLHGTIYPGQMIFLENMIVDDSGKCCLKTWEHGQLYNISSMKGYISSPSLYKLTTGTPDGNKRNLIVVARIAELKQAKEAYCSRVHSSCLQPVKETGNLELCCPTCDCSSLVADPCGSKQSPEDVSKFWTWKYSLRIRLEIRPSKDEIICSTSEQFCQELLQISSREFIGLDERKQNSVLNNHLDTTLVFSVSCSRGIFLLNAFTDAPDSFLKYLLEE